MGCVLCQIGVSYTFVQCVPQAKKIYRIEEQLNNSFIKIFSETDKTKKKLEEINILLKISGIWHNKDEMGITFRFFFTHLLEMT